MSASEQGPPKITLLTKWRVAMAILARYGGCGTTAIGLRLLDHFNAKTRRCDPSYAVLAKATGMTRRNAMRCVEELVVDGFLKIIEERKGISNTFGFDWDRAGDIPVTSGGDMDDTGLVTSMSPASDVDVIADGDTGVTQNNEDRNRELKSELKLEDKDADEALDQLIAGIEVTTPQEILKPRQRTERSALKEIERSFVRLTGLNAQEAIPHFRQIPDAALRALIRRCTNGRLDHATVARVAEAVVTK